MNFQRLRRGGISQLMERLMRGDEGGGISSLSFVAWPWRCSDFSKCRGSADE